RFVEIKSILVESVDGPAVVAFARDVSARKRVEQELLRADRLAAVGMLSAAVAHEINNPLTYVQLCLQFLERSLVDASTPAQRQALLDHLANARHGVERVATIVRDLRTFARSHDDDRGPADVVAAVEHAIKLAENELRHRARLVRKFETVPLVTGGGSRLEQVFLNLLINAMHALPDGDPARDEVVVEIAPLGDAMVEIIVADTGVGVPGPLRDRVFEPFFTTKPIGEGTGLGLSVCRGIVESAGGSIALEGVEPHGTRVRVRLPVHQTTRAAPEPEVTVAAAEPGRRLRVLVVDDEPLVRRMLAVVLSRRHDVVLAENGRDALAEIQRGAEFDAIVCDLMMPELNGMELFEAVSTAIPALATRFVFITGGALGPRLAKFLDDVDAPTLYKPFQMQVVLDAVHAAAERGRG
ncbi:MAG: response regulator, partial [Myxococcales bacterium]|nr:response regulator [Myxococcales bacterium]